MATNEYHNAVGTYKITHGPSNQRITEAPRYKVAADGRTHCLVLSHLDLQGRYIGDVVVIEADASKTTMGDLWKQYRLQIMKKLEQAQQPTSLS